MTLSETDIRSRNHRNFISALDSYVTHLLGSEDAPHPQSQLDRLADEFSSSATLNKQTAIDSLVDKVDAQFPLLFHADVPPKSLDLNATYELFFDIKLPESAKPSLIHLLVTLGFQLDYYETILGSFVVGCKYRGLPQRVVGEINDAPVAVQLLSGYRDHPEDPESEVHAHDRLYHVEMDVSKQTWDWAWSMLKFVPALADVLMED